MSGLPRGAVNPAPPLPAAMAITDRLPDTVWPSEPNVGGHHLTVRYLSVPVFLALAALAAAGLIPGVTGIAAVAVAALASGAAGLSVVEIRTRKCFGYALMGLDTCPMPEPSQPAEEAA